MQIQIPDRNQIEQAFTMIMTAPSETLRKEADAYLRDLEKNNVLIMVTLLDIFENTTIFQLRYQSLILLKNVIIRNWIKMSIQNSKRVPNVSDDLKNIIKQKMVSFLGVIQDPKLKKEINLILQSIAKHDFPHKFQLLSSYFIQGMQTIQQQIINDPNQVQSQFCFDLIVSLKCVENEVNKIRMVAFKNMQYEFVSQILGNLINIWETVTRMQLTDLNISKKIDRLLSCCIQCFHPEVDLEKIQKIFMMLLNKIASLIQLVPNNKLLQPNIKTLAHSLTNIQHIFPLSIIQGFGEYLQLLKLLISTDWQDQRITKTGLIGFSKVLKTYFYYCTDDQFKATIAKPKHPNYFEINLQAKTIFQQFFLQEIPFLLQTLIRISSVPQDLSEEDLIEQEEDNSIDDLKNELHCPIYTLCLIVVEQMMIRFPDLTLSNMSTLLQQLISNNFTIGSPQIMESFFAFLGQIPRVITKLQIKEIKNVVNILPVLQYLSRSTTLQNVRRCAILCNRYIFTFQTEELTDVMQLVIFLMVNSNDQIVKYQALMSIHSIIRGVAVDQNINWVSVMEKVVPIIVELLHNLQKATIIWPLLQLLEKLIIKCQQSTELVAKTISQGNLQNLMLTKQELLVDALCDMFKTLLTSFPIGTYVPQIYELTFLLIDSNLGSKKSSILSFYLFILQEYSDSLQLGEQLNGLFLKHQNSLIEEMDLQNMQIVLQIIEENLLLGFIRPEQYPSVIQIVEDRYQIALNIQEHDIGIQIKNSCLSVVQTILLTNYQDISKLLNLLKIEVTDFIKIRSPLHHILSFAIKSIEINNKFIIQDANGFGQFLQSMNVNISDYLFVWLENSQFLKYDAQKRANVVALLLFIQQMNFEFFKNTFEQVLTIIFPELDMEQDLQDVSLQQKVEQNKISNENCKYNRLSQFRASSRKRILSDQRDQMNLREFVNGRLQILLAHFKVDNISNLIKDKDLFEKLLLIQSQQ